MLQQPRVKSSLHESVMYRLRRAAAFAFFIGLPDFACAADFGAPRDIAETFNTYASAMSFSQRMILRKCNGSSDNICMFSVPGKVTILASASEQKPDQTQLIVFGADRSSDAKQFVSAASIAMIAYSPNKDAKEVRAAFKILFASPMKDFNEVQIKDVKFVLKQIDGGGVFFSVKDASLTSD